MMGACYRLAAVVCLAVPAVAEDAAPLFGQAEHLGRIRGPEWELDTEYDRITRKLRWAKAQSPAAQIEMVTGDTVDTFGRLSFTCQPGRPWETLVSLDKLRSADRPKADVAGSPWGLIWVDYKRDLLPVALQTQSLRVRWSVGDTFETGKIELRAFRSDPVLEDQWNWTLAGIRHPEPAAVWTKVQKYQFLLIELPLADYLELDLTEAVEAVRQTLKTCGQGGEL